MPRRMLYHWIIMSLLATLFAAPAFAEGPAVAGINGKVQGLYGHAEGDELEAVGASLTLPLCSHSGLQLDGAYGELGSDQIKGVGLHLFTRDPEKYLLGILATHAELQDVDLNRTGVEGELYNGPVTIASFLGYQQGDVDHALFGTVDLRWYPRENLMLVTGFSLADSDDNQLHLGAEYQVVAGLSAFVDFAAGENRYEHALFGLKYYFGGQKNLIQRHREDDPDNPIVSNVLQGINSLRDEQEPTRPARRRFR